jgi:hypothetical protein
MLLVMIPVARGMVVVNSGNYGRSDSGNYGR